MRHYLTLLSAALVVMATWAGPRNNILTLKQSITDNDIVFPDSRDDAKLVSAELHHSRLRR